MAILLKLAIVRSSMEEVEAFRGANLKSEVWNPLIAESINEKAITFLIDNKVLKSTDTKLYMNENLNLMIPISVLRDNFNCSTHLYDKKELFVEKRENELEFVLNEPTIRVNQKKSEIISPMVLKGEEYYISAQAVSEHLNFNYNWDMDKNQAVAMDSSMGVSILPTSYDLREKHRAPPIKDQGKYGTCWAFAALAGIESTLLPEQEKEFSPDHMSIQNSFYLEQVDGGEYTMGMAYLAAWQGPVYEKDDPYGDEASPEDLPPKKHVQEIQIIEEKDFEGIKEAVFQYGGVQTSIYSAFKDAKSKSMYYNSENNAYCYIGTEKPNHDVLIIGWDDHYSKDNFNMELEADGAFICQNSWGSDFGEDGVFYISYYDVAIGIHNVVYTSIKETDNYDHIYQSDLCGWVGQLGYDKEEIYAANIYTAKSDEQLVAAGFYATGKNTDYELYIVKNYVDQNSLSSRALVATGKVSNAGYYTIDFNRNINVKAGERYAVMMHILTPGSIHPIAIEFNAGESTSKVDLSDGEGYISAKGKTWEHVEETQNCNLCLKVYSKDQ
ncbi:lectin like domain-containing protein [Lachnospiraceae bacterium ZAX-1]